MSAVSCRLWCVLSIALALALGACRKEEMPGRGDVRFSQDVYWVDEDAGAVAIGVTRSGGNAGTFGAAIVTIADNSDVFAYGSNDGAQWADGEDGTKLVPIEIVDNDEVSGNKTLRIELMKTYPDFVQQHDVATVVIRDDESPPSPFAFTNADYGRFEYERPLAIVAAPGNNDLLYVVEQPGTIWVMSRSRAISGEIFLFFNNEVTYAQNTESGLLGLAFDPDFATNGYFYVNYTAGGLETRISRFHAPTRYSADPGSEQVLLSFAQPDYNHNGGWLGFGPDGKLYVGSGDGGGANDPDGNGQNLDTLLGKILRMNSDGSVPADNPFAADGDPSTRGEIWAYGFRNPWRGGFDRQTGELWIGDVGQDAREEIDLVVAGGNYGWDACEGTLCSGAAPAGHRSPLFEYTHATGQSITGGYRYRGPLAAATGKYFYGDFISGRVWALDYDGSAVTGNRLIATIPLLSSFGEDLEGNLYAVSYQGYVYRLIAP